MKSSSVKSLGGALLIGLSAFFLLWLPEDSVDNAPNKNIKMGGLDVAVWLPPERLPKPWPVIIYSHGITACNTQAAYMMRALALRGYLVLAPNHRDRSCAIEHMLPIKKPLGKPEQWVPGKDAADRIDDVKTILDMLAQQFAEADMKHIGVAGFSMGGYTALSLAGGSGGAPDTRIKAVLAMGPYSAPFLTHGHLEQIHIPLMYQAGTGDIISGIKHNQLEAYRRTGGRKWYVEFAVEWHGAWNGNGVMSPVQRQFTDYAIAFFDTTLKNKQFPLSLEKPRGNVTDFRYQP